MRVMPIARTQTVSHFVVCERAQTADEVVFTWSATMPLLSLRTCKYQPMTQQGIALKSYTAKLSWALRF